MDREELIKQIDYLNFYEGSESMPDGNERLADFILARESECLKPLVEMVKKHSSYGTMPNTLPSVNHRMIEAAKAIDQTLINFGVK